MAPANPHVTSVAVYPALFISILSRVILCKVTLTCSWGSLRQTDVDQGRNHDLLDFEERKNGRKEGRKEEREEGRKEG